MNSLIHNTTNFIIEFLKLFLCCKLVIDIKTKNSKILLYILSSASLFVFCSSIYIDWSLHSLFYGILSIVIISFITTPKKNVKYIILIYIFICIVDMIFSAVFIYIFTHTGNDLQGNYMLNIIVNSISLIVISLFLLIKLKIKGRYKKTYNSVTLTQILIYIFGGIGLGLYITSVQYFGFDELKSSTTKLIALGLSMSSLMFIVICTSLIITRNKNKHLSEENAINAKLVKTQEEYYKMLLNKDEETKKFRHDMSSHIYCMHTLLIDEEYDELDRYFTRIGSSLSELTASVNTGNKLIDSIINDLSIKHPDTVINWTGSIPSDITLNSMDLCTVFANVLSNAFEASKLINVYVKVLETAMFITIINTIEKKPKIINGKIISHKNKNGHGYGIQNIERCMKKNGGSFTYKVEDQNFIAEIILPNSIN